MALVGNPNFSIAETSAVESPNLSTGEVAPDLELCGERKRGNEIQEIDAAMENAKGSRQVSEFTDIDDLLSRFKEKMIFEEEDFDLMRDYCDSDEDYDMKEEMKKSLPFDKEPVLKYISQVRKSGGFDVDVKLPRWLDVGWNFIHIPLSHSSLRDYAYERAKLVIDEINVDMKSKTFELVEVVKAVMSLPICDLSFFTLAVKKVGADAAVTIQAIVFHPFDAPWELKEWRFKP